MPGHAAPACAPATCQARRTRLDARLEQVGADERVVRAGQLQPGAVGVLAARARVGLRVDLEAADACARRAPELRWGDAQAPMQNARSAHRRSAAA